MRLQVFSKYYILAEEGKVDPLACPMHELDKPAIFPLIHWMDEEKLKVMLECKACGYKKQAGLDLYLNLLKRIGEVVSEEL